MNHSPNQKINYTERFASHPDDIRNYDTSKLREHFLVSNLFIPEQINLVYSHFDRFIVGGVAPVHQPLKLETIEPLKASYFLQRREIGIINIGQEGIVASGQQNYKLGNKDALYLGSGNQDVIFSSVDPKAPANFYINSAPAHNECQSKLIKYNDAEILEAGNHESSNARKINKLIINSVVKTCQLQMGLTELKSGSVWNTMPAHVHSRRMEVYFYFDLAEGQAVCHFMGQPHETRHIWLKNREAVISPDWSIHSAAGTGNYCFIWGMAGENLDYSDMDTILPTQLK